MFTFSIYVFGKWSTYADAVDAARCAELVAWAKDNEFSYVVTPV